MYTLAVIQVKDAANWKASFDDEQSKTARAAAGEKAYQLFRTADDPNKLLLLNEWESAEKMREFLQSDTLRQLQQDSGVVETPQSFVLEEIDKGTL